MRHALKTIGIVLLVLLVLVTGGFLYMRYAMHGFSARAQPSHVETMLATYARDTAMPATAKSMVNPVADSVEVEHQAMAHFADHCAVCHGNNGSGETMFGSGLYPKPPDLRGRTQSMSDGEIFFVIENGIRMSGMPAFGGQESDSAEDTWKLVRFIRHLPKLTPEEEQQMEALNPKGPDELKEEQEEREFLNGGDSSVSAHQKGKYK